MRYSFFAHGWPAGGWASDNVTAEVVPGAQHFSAGAKEGFKSAGACYQMPCRSDG